MSQPASAAPGARLATSQAKRMRRILEAAVELADRGGYDAVRLRDVAENADVALGTLYKYFRSKEDLLLFVVNEGTAALEHHAEERPLRGPDAQARLEDLFVRATHGVIARPDLSRAAFRAIAVGGTGADLQLAAFHLRMTRLVVAALRGEGLDLARPLTEPVGTDWERRVALVLEQVWFAALLGWASRLHPAETIRERVSDTAQLLLGEAE